MSIPVYSTEEDRLSLHIFEPPRASIQCDLEYLNEGGANFVFHIRPGASGQELPTSLRGKLLRLRKNLSHVQGAEEQFAAFEKHFKPLFPPKNLVQHELIELGDGLPALVNTTLVSLDRPGRRAQELLPPHEKYGLLITDMTAQREEVLVSLKPKWLAQSPNAPPGANRCRTCALRAMRRSQQVRTATDAQNSCPLALISDVTEERMQALRIATSDEKLQDYLANDGLRLLLTLKEWQESLDQYGVAADQDETMALSLCKAMTLRDCTLYLRRSGDRIEARLADLDLKHSEKLPAWRALEQRLAVEGWYTNTENESMWVKEDVCILSRHAG